MTLAFWNRTVMYAHSPARRKNGAVRARSFHAMRFLRHHTHSNSTAGVVTTEVLLRSAAANITSDRAYHRWREVSSNFRYPIIVRR